MSLDMTSRIEALGLRRDVVRRLRHPTDGGHSLDTIADLIACTKPQLLRWPGIGYRLLEDIESGLGRHGLHLLPYR